MSAFGRYACIFIGLLLFVPLILTLNDAGFFFKAVAVLIVIILAVIGFTLILAGLTVPVQKPKSTNESVLPS